MQRTGLLNWRRITTLLAPGRDEVAVAEIVADPVQTASEQLLAAYRSLKTADPGASDAQLFTQLRLMVNKLEHGGLRNAPPPPEPRPPAREPTVAEQVFATDWFGALRNRSRRLRKTLRRLSD